MTPRIASYHHGATMYGTISPNRLDQAQPQDRIHVEHSGASEGGTIFESGSVNRHGHTVWHNGQKVAPHLYRKVLVADGQIKIRTYAKEVTVIEDGESSEGMRSGYVESVKPV